MTDIEHRLTQADRKWARRLDDAARWLGVYAPGTDDWVRLDQKFVACSRRGTHYSLKDCSLCAGDVLRGDATEDDCLLPLDLREVGPPEWDGCEEQGRAQ